MSHRIAQPGEQVSLSPGCGHHCGIRSAAEGGEAAIKVIGHCGCAECTCPLDGAQVEGSVLGSARIPMCDGWSVTVITDDRIPPGGALVVSGESMAAWSFTPASPQEP
jgi:hypothetical protein